MSYFQNVLSQEFRGNWVLGDRQYVVEFVAPANQNKYDYQLARNGEPYNLSGSNNILTLNYAWDLNYVNYSTLTINVAGVVPGATLASEVAAALNANAIFADMFNAIVTPVQIPPQPSLAIPNNTQVGQVPPTTYFPNNTPNTFTVLILPKSGRIKPVVRLWITNGSAEQFLRFNGKASVTQMPLYMARHTVANRFAFPDSQGCLVLLSHRITNISVAGSTVVTAPAHGLTNGATVYIGGSNSTPSIDGSNTATVIDANTFSIPVTVSVAGDRGEALSAVENYVVTQAGYTISQVQTDWQLLGGRSGIFNFQNITVDGSNRITQIIEYPAGAQVGDFSRKIQYVYSGANTSPSQITEIPYVLLAADLILPN